MSRVDPEIDIVITWVDGSDPAWQREKARLVPSAGTDHSPQRYRDSGLLKYLFRGIDEFAPWVRTVHLVTWGHIPVWLDTGCPKLHIVRHEDYIPSQWLPTFSSHPIELNLHRIGGLAEQFIYFNDDMFLLRPVAPGDFFKHGLPVDDAVLSPVIPDISDPIGKVVYSNMEIINKHFDKPSVIKNNFSKLINPRYGVKLIRTLFLLPWHHLLGFYNDHLPSPFLKSTLEELWVEEEELLAEVSSHHFRDYSNDVNQWLFRYWQFCSGRFLPCSPKGRYLEIDAVDTPSVIKKQKYRMICINDSPAVDERFDEVRLGLTDAFESILPRKCSFEK